MQKAIVTGFGPFGPYKFNPVQDTAKEFNRKTVGDIEILGLVLPCTYYGASRFLSDEIDRYSPDIILSTGLSSGVKCIRFEAIGRNWMNGKYADAGGRIAKNEPIIPKEEDFFETNANNIKLANSLYKAKIPSEVSIDAEGFICNSLIYLTSRKIKKENLPIKFAFFHTPWTSDYLNKINLERGKITIEKSDLRKAIEITLKSI